MEPSNYISVILQRNFSVDLFIAYNMTISNSWVLRCANLPYKHFMKANYHAKSVKVLVNLLILQISETDFSPT